MKSKTSVLLAILAVLPFTVGFVPPEQEGTHLSVSAGQGRFLAGTSGCAHPRKVEYVDQQAGAYHVWKFKAKYAPRFGVGADFNTFKSREKECTEEDCANDSPGWESHPRQFSLSPYLTFDWTWIGVGAGGYIPLEFSSNPGHGFSTGWLYSPIRGSLRVGPVDRLYATVEIFNGQPVNSGFLFPLGIGGRLYGFDLLGLAIPPISDGGAASGVIARRFGPVRLRMSGTYLMESDDYKETSAGEVREQFTVEYPRQSFAVGLDYHIPW